MKESKADLEKRKVDFGGAEDSQCINKKESEKKQSKEFEPLIIWGRLDWSQMG